MNGDNSNSVQRKQSLKSYKDFPKAYGGCPTADSAISRHNNTPKASTNFEKSPFKAGFEPWTLVFKRELSQQKLSKSHKWVDNY